MDGIERDNGDRLAEPVDRLAHHALRGAVWPKASRTFVRREPRPPPARRTAKPSPVSSRLWSRVAHLPEDRDTIAQAIDVHLQLMARSPRWDRTDQIQELPRPDGRTRRLARDRNRIARVLALQCVYLERLGLLDRAADAGRTRIDHRDDSTTSSAGHCRYGLGVTFHELGELSGLVDLLSWVVDALDPKVAGVSDPRAR